MKNTLSLLATAFSAALIFSLFSCKKEIVETPDSGYVFSPEELAHINKSFCKTVSRPVGAEDRATGLKGMFWPKGSTLKVKFLNGSPALKNKVLSYAKIWEQHANITFSEVTSGKAEIRVKFGKVGNDSSIGIDNLTVPKIDPTMNLEFTKQSTDEEIRAVTLHEFGHALGLCHEHQSPMANIPWNKPKVYAYFGNDPLDPWTPQEVDENVLAPLNWEDSQHTVFDPKSIMAYPIPDSLTTNGFSIPWNTELSTLDKEFIKKMYSPFPINLIRHAADIPGPITFLLNGIYTTLEKDSSIAVLGSVGTNTIQIWECPDACQWSSFEISNLIGYRIVSNYPNSNNPNDLTIEEDAGYSPVPTSKSH